MIRIFYKAYYEKKSLAVKKILVTKLPCKKILVTTRGVQKDPRDYTHKTFLLIFSIS